MSREPRESSGLPPDDFRAATPCVAIGNLRTGREHLEALWKLIVKSVEEEG